MTELATEITATEQERLEQAEALVRNFCGWHIAGARTETVAVRARGGHFLMLPSMYVTAVASVTNDGGVVLVVEDDYTWSTSGVITSGGWWGTGVVTVVMTHGYVTPPPEVTAVVQAVAQRAVDNPGSLSRQQIGPFSNTYSTTGGEVPTLSLLQSERDTLRRYRIPGIG